MGPQNDATLDGQDFSVGLSLYLPSNSDQKHHC